MLVDRERDVPTGAAPRAVVGCVLAPLVAAEQRRHLVAQR
jgi:hypothetical protein